ncbi:Nuclear pore complex protein GP210 [Linum perenne]
MTSVPFSPSLLQHLFTALLTVIATRCDKIMGSKMLPTALLIVSMLLMAEETTSSSPSLASSGPHIADVNILLPHKMTYSVDYRLQGYDGCFKWSWDHHDILSVLPEYNTSSYCSTSAMLRSIAPFNGRKETAVYATDTQSGVVIRCKVFIDKISRIQIFHSSIKLDLDGLATLRVHAFDGEDNVFSSLVGIQFMWKLVPEHLGSHHLVHVPLKHSPLSDCGGLCAALNFRIKLEDDGVFSDLCIVKGVGIGHETVSVQMHEPQHEHMVDEIVFTVAEAMSVDPPSPVFVLVGAVLQYNLKVIKGNVPQVVALPSPYHHWSVFNTTVAEVDPMHGYARALSLGVTSIVVKDTRIAGHIQLSSLNVVVPEKLYLYIVPLSDSGDSVEGVKPISSGGSWYAVCGRSYLIKVKVFSGGPDAQEIYITEKDNITWFDGSADYWTTLLPSPASVVEHGWWNYRLINVTSPGVGKLTASLTFFHGNRGTEQVLTVEQKVFICDQVKFTLDGKVTSQVVHLPWVPAVYQEVELKAVGGCSKLSADYKWYSSDTAIVSISTSAIALAKKPGKAIMKVVSGFDSFNYDEVIIEISLPSSMVMLPNFPVETVVGLHLQSAVTLKSSNGAYFYRCDAFHSFVNWRTGSDSFVVLNATEKPLPVEKLADSSHHVYVTGPPCSWADIYASDSGQTLLQAILSKEYHNFDHHYHRPLVLKASSRIAAYLPLILGQLGDGNQYGGYSFKETDDVENLEKLNLVPGTSLDVILLGGPKQWDNGVEFIETVEVLDDNNVKNKDGLHVRQLTSSYTSTYRILCSNHGTYKLVFKRGNLVGDEHPVPAVAEVTMFVTCSIPSSIALIIDEPVNERDLVRTVAVAERSTGQIQITPITVASVQTLRVSAVGIASSGEAFANSSSLDLKWDLYGCEGLAYWDYAYESKRSKSSWERFLVLQNETGQCIVRATIRGFRESIRSQYSSEMPDRSLTDAIHLQLVSTLRLTPEFSLLYSNPNAKVNLSVVGGSCLLKAATNNSQVVKVLESPPALQCFQLTISPKGSGIANVTVYDIGLVTPVAASAVVQVADMEWIKIVSGEKISLMEGQSRSINLICGINSGHTFDSSQYAYMELVVHTEDGVVEAVNSEKFGSFASLFVNAPNFEIIGKRLGLTTLYVSARQQSGNEILSQPIQVEVFAPLKLQPEEIFLAPGASYMLNVEGGPTIGQHVEFASEDETIATVDKGSGRLSAISPGNTTIISTVYGLEETICKASTRLEVGVPSLLKLNVQSEQLDIGSHLPIYPLFQEGNLFSFYELCKGYTWTINDDEVMDFYKVEKLLGDKQWFPLYDDKEPDFIKVLYGRSAGRTAVAVTFSCDFISSSYSQSRMYDASVSLLVVPDIRLVPGAPTAWILPPHYITSSLLPSFSESSGQRDGSKKGTITYSLLRNCGEKNAIKQSGVILEGDRIRTTESNNLACIQAKDRITGKTEIACCIRVAEVAQVRMTNKEFPFHAIYLSVGAELDLPVTYFDTLGNPFHEAHYVVPYQVETNHQNILSLGDIRQGSMNIHLKALQSGRALVRVSLTSNQQKSDYVLTLRCGRFVWQLHVLGKN